MTNKLESLYYFPYHPSMEANADAPADVLDVFLFGETVRPTKSSTDFFRTVELKCVTWQDSDQTYLGGRRHRLRPLGDPRRARFVITRPRSYYAALLPRLAGRIILPWYNSPITIRSDLPPFHPRYDPVRRSLRRPGGYEVCGVPHFSPLLVRDSVFRVQLLEEVHPP
jgi:hypothetical protein